MKLATVDVESGDNMATLPVASRAAAATSGGSSGGSGGGGGGGAGDMNTIEKNNATNKEMELKNVMAKPLQRSISTLSSTSCCMYVDGSNGISSRAVKPVVQSGGGEEGTRSK